MKKIFFLVLLSGLATMGLVTAAAATADKADVTTENGTQIQYKPGFDKAALEASLKASGEWLKQVDGGNYGPSWDAGATIYKMTMPRDEWVTYLEKIRKPLGSVSSRDILDQRVSKDPKGLPKGDYMVMFYSTKFSGGKTANELVTLQNEDGTWKVMGYYIKESKE